MDRRMHVTPALCLLLLITDIHTFVPGVDGPVSRREGLETGNVTLPCDSTPDTNDKLEVLVWYKNNVSIYSYEVQEKHVTEWSNESFNTSGRLTVNLRVQPTTLTVSSLTEADQALYHCRVDFMLAPTRNIGINLTVVVLPSQPFFLDELDNKVENKIGPYHEGDTLVLNCLVIGGFPPPRITWYSGDMLVDASDGATEIPGIRENQLYLPLTRANDAALSCRAANTDLAPPIVTTLEVELYLAASKVSIHWVSGTNVEHALVAGRSAVAKCTAAGSRPAPDLSWWLDHRHLTHHSNQTWLNSTGSAVSFLRLTPSAGEHGATLACIATNPAMTPDRGSKADVITLNVTYSPIVEVTNLGDENNNEVVELDPLHLGCEVRANPPVHTFVWYYNDEIIESGGEWGDNTSASTLRVEEATRRLAGAYSCSARNALGETRAEHNVTIQVLYPPECAEGVLLIKEMLHCNVLGLPAPDTYFWHIWPAELEVQQLTTGSSILPLSQITGPLAGPLRVKCEGGNGIASQYIPCEKSISLDHLRPPQPQQCDLAYEYKEFHMRCIPVENATYYEVTVWRMSTSNSSLILEHRGSMGFGSSQVQAQGGLPWLVRGALGKLKIGDEAGASACNRYGCSRALLLRPTENILNAAASPWWHFFLEKDVGISIGAVVLVAVFITSTALIVKYARRPRQKSAGPVIQVLQLDDVARDYIEGIAEHKVHASCSLRSCSQRSCSSGYSDGSEGPPVDRHRKPRAVWDHWDPPPPDVTLTLHRESTV